MAQTFLMAVHISIKEMSLLKTPVYSFPMNAFWQSPKSIQDTGGVNHRRLSFSLQKENISCSTQKNSVSPF